jgi:GLPGLI family protein
MKSVLFLMTLAFFTITARGQEHKSEVITSGKITYEEKVKIDIRIEGDVSHMAGMLPKERIAEKILTFTEEASLFEDGNSNPEDEISSQHSEGGTVRFRMVVTAENKIFTDLKNKKILDQRDFMNRIFLVEKEFPESDWKITGNQKVIQGLQCSEAIRLDTAGKKTVAWFAPSIAISSGPAGLCNLPGMILEVDFNDGQRTITAKSIEAVGPGEVRLQKPKDGKKVTEEEYKKIVAEKMKEMGIEEGGSEGGAQMRIVIQQH